MTKDLIDIEINGTILDQRKTVSKTEAAKLVASLIDCTNDNDRIVIVYLSKGIKRKLELEGN